MARTSTVTENNTGRLHYLLKTSRDEEALTLAESMLDNELHGYPLAPQHAQSYKFVAIAYSRNRLPADFLLRTMMDCVHPSRASMLCASYFEFVGDNESRAHPFFASIVSVVASFRYSLKQPRTTK